MQIFRHESTKWFWKITNRIVIRRSLASKSGNLYEVLGLQRNATANDIKNAYYSLSMIHHPDKNIGPDSQEAADKFRQITEAYEILGNFRLRKLYDKGMVHTTAGEKYRGYTEVHKEPTEDDPTARFYKARMHKEKSTATGRTPIYDFDEWTRSHYTDTFKEEQKSKRFQHEKAQIRKVHLTDFRTEMGLLFGLGSATVFLMILATIGEWTRDLPFDTNTKSEIPKEQKMSGSQR